LKGRRSFAFHFKNQLIYYEAVCAAGNWEVDAAWSHIAGLLTTEKRDYPLLLDAIEAVVSIRLREASEILLELADPNDEAIAVVKVFSGYEDDDVDDESIEYARLAISRRLPPLWGV